MSAWRSGSGIQGQRAEDRREEVERVHGLHARSGPVARSSGGRDRRPEEVGAALHERFTEMHTSGSLITPAEPVDELACACSAAIVAPASTSRRPR